MKKRLVYDGKYWQLILHDDQTYLGRCILASKTKKKNFLEFTTEEATELLEIIQMTEVAMQKVFNAIYFNWTALNNDAYKESERIKYSFHLHVRPRYSHPVNIAGYTFEDPNFGHHYKRHTDTHIPSNVMELILTELQKFF